MHSTLPYAFLLEAESALDLTQLCRGVLEYCILALLDRQERYGYDLVTDLADVGLVASEGSVYPVLSRLRRGQLVETTWQESPSGPPRRYYRLTPAGRDALSAFRPAWNGFIHSVNAVLEKG